MARSIAWRTAVEFATAATSRALSASASSGNCARRSGAASVSMAADEQPDVGELLLALHAELREQASRGAIRASGIAADVTLTDPDSGDTTDAVQLELDHADIEAVDVYVPYTTGDEGIEFGELVAAAGQAPIFSDE